MNAAEPSAPSWFRTSSLGRALLGSGPALLVAALGLGWFLFINLDGNVFEFDPDEGNNVIKALLVAEGHAYGTEIWTDQPPLFTYFLLPAFQLFGRTMDVARAVVSVSSAALIFGLYEALRRSLGHVGGLAGVGLLLTSALYVPLSVSVMIGMPSVACLTLGVMLAGEVGRLRGPRAWLAAAGAGALAGAAVGIKLFALPVVPVVLVLASASGASASAGAISGETEPRPLGWARLKRAGLAAGAFSGGLLAMLLLAMAPLLIAGTWSGLVDTHQAARDRAGGDMDGLSTLTRFVSDDPVLFSLALLGSLVALGRRNFGALAWLAWLAAATLALLDHSPVWPHHRLLLTVPAAALAAQVFPQHLPEALPRAVRTASRFVLPALALFAVALAVTSKGRLDAMRRPPAWTNSDTDWQVFEEFARYAEHSTYVAAARPTYAFRAGRPVPPDLAVTSWKRFRVGLLTNKQVAEDVTKAKPETILLSSRWPGSVRNAVEKKIKKTHKRVKRWRHQSSDLWVEKRLLSRTNGTAESTDRTDDSEP